MIDRNYTKPQYTRSDYHLSAVCGFLTWSIPFFCVKIPSKRPELKGGKVNLCFWQLDRITFSDLIQLHESTRTPKYDFNNWKGLQTWQGISLRKVITWFRRISQTNVNHVIREGGWRKTVMKYFYIKSGSSTVGVKTWNSL